MTRAAILPLLVMLGCSTTPTQATHDTLTQRDFVPEVLSSPHLRAAHMHLNDMELTRESASMHGLFTLALTLHESSEQALAYEELLRARVHAEVSDEEIKQAWLGDYDRALNQSVDLTKITGSTLARRDQASQMLAVLPVLEPVTARLVEPDERASETTHGKDHVLVQLWRARALMERGDKDAAKELLLSSDESMLAVSSHERSLRTFWNRLMVQLGERDLARQYMMREVAILLDDELSKTRRIEALTWHCEELLDLDAPGDALKFCNEAIKLYPKSSKRPSSLLSTEGRVDDRLIELASQAAERSGDIELATQYAQWHANTATRQALLMPCFMRLLDEQKYREALTFTETFLGTRARVLALLRLRQSEDGELSQEQLRKWKELMASYEETLTEVLPNQDTASQVGLLVELAKYNDKIEGLAHFTLDSLISIYTTHSLDEERIQAQLQIILALGETHPEGKRMFNVFKDEIKNLPRRDNKLGESTLEHESQKQVASLWKSAQDNEAILTVLIKGLRHALDVGPVLKMLPEHYIRHHIDPAIEVALVIHALALPYEDLGDRIELEIALLRICQSAKSLELVQASLFERGERDKVDPTTLVKLYRAWFASALHHGATAAQIQDLLERKAVEINLVALAMIDVLYERESLPPSWTLDHVDTLNTWMRDESKISIHRAKLATVYARQNQCTYALKLSPRVQSMYPVGLAEQVYACRDQIPHEQLYTWTRDAARTKSQFTRELAFALVYEQHATPPSSTQKGAPPQ